MGNHVNVNVNYVVPGMIVCLRCQSPGIRDRYAATDVIFCVISVCCSTNPNLENHVVDLFTLNALCTDMSAAFTHQQSVGTHGIMPVDVVQFTIRSRPPRAHLNHSLDKSVAERMIWESRHTFDSSGASFFKYWEFVWAIT